MAKPNPNDFRNLIPGPTSNLCDKIAKILIQLPAQLYILVSYLFNSSGTDLGDEFKADLCALGCAGGSNPNMPVPASVSATDGTHLNKVTVSWSAVSVPDGIEAVTSYRIYRATADITDPNSATLIGNVTAPTTAFDDTTMTVGIQYHYWVRAINISQESGYGGPDVGHAGSLSGGGGGGTLAAATDLRVTKGFSKDTSGFIRVVFVPPLEATKFDIYRHTADDFGAASLLAADVVPMVPPNGILVGPVSYKNVQTNYLGGAQLTEWIYYDTPPDGETVYFYWVKVKTTSLTATESNSDSGWVKLGTGETIVGVAADFVDATPVTVPGGATKMKVALFSMGGGGAGAGSVLGGGGGGGGAVVLCDIPVTPGDEVTFFNEDQQNTGGPGGSGGVGNGNTPAGEYGASGDGITLDLNGTSIIQVLAGIGGQYYAPTPFASGGSGGNGNLVSPFTDPSFLVYRGKEGSNGRSGTGGYGGWMFGFLQNKTTQVENNFEGDESGGGGGTPNSSNPSLGIGGKRGQPAYGIYCFI